MRPGKLDPSSPNRSNTYQGYLYIICPNERLKNKSGTGEHWKSYWCICTLCDEIGCNPISIDTIMLRKNVKSCGCLKKFGNMAENIKPGDKFNNWKVIRFDQNKFAWECICDCSNDENRMVRFLTGKQLNLGNPKSCGHLIKENSAGAINLINKKTDPVPSRIVAKRIFRDRYSDGDLNFDDFLFLSQLPCFYCGISCSASMVKKPSKYSFAYNFTQEKLTFKYNGLDRIDSNLKHDFENCVPACFICNRAKSNLNKDSFIDKLRQISSYDPILSFEQYRELSKFIDPSILYNPTNYGYFRSIRNCYKASYIDGDLTINQFYGLSQLNCYYCGEFWSNESNHPKRILNNGIKGYKQFAADTGTFRFNSLDRIDSTLPHNYNNLITACLFCNRAKSDLPIEEFMAWKDRLKKYYID